ncbi:MAG: M43 family zinc metalloprotease [Breznakibacter sp.]
MKKILTLSLLCCFYLAVWSQHDHSSCPDGHDCKADHQMEVLFNANPAAKVAHQQMVLQQHPLQQYYQKRSVLKSRSRDKYIIPVVFHVFGTNFNQGTKVTYELVEQALRKTNEDYLALSEYCGDVDARFKNVQGTLNIEFRLAKIDPQGNPSTGVLFHPVRSGFGNGAGYDAEIQKFAWDNGSYMNVYIMQDLYADGDVYNSGVAWYPNEWMTANNLARVVYNGSYLGANTNENFRRVLSHEFGHFFNLAHTFEGGCTYPNDEVVDTPPADNSRMGRNDLNCEGNPTNWENFMNYTSRYAMFTKGQVSRMLAALDHPTRASLHEPQNLLKTGVNDGYEQGACMIYGSTLFEEAVENNGAIANSLQVDLLGGPKFKDGALVEGVDYRCANLPAGLTMRVSRLSEVKALVLLEGTALRHESANNVDDLTLEFLPAAFSTGNAQAIKQLVKSNLNVGFKDAYTSYCVHQSRYKTYAGITHVQFGDINHTSKVNYYSDYTQGVVSVVNPGQIIPLTVTANQHETGRNDRYVMRVWFDWNGDHYYSANERFFNQAFSFNESDANGNYSHTQSIVIPQDALVNTMFGMRVFLHLEEGKLGEDPCGVVDNGEAEDYGILILPPATELTAHFIASASRTLVGEPVKFTSLSTSPQSDPIVSWEWRFDGGKPSSFSGKTPPEVFFEEPGHYDVALKVKSQSGIEKELLMPRMVETYIEYCVPTISYAVYCGITKVVLGGINHSSDNSSRYQDYTNLVASLERGGNYPITITLDQGNGHVEDYNRVQVWADWNCNSIFEPSELAVSHVMKVSDMVDGKYTFTETLAVPLQAKLKRVPLRVMVHYVQKNDGNDPCGTIDSGEIEDYSVNVADGGRMVAANLSASTARPNIHEPVQFFDISTTLNQEQVVAWEWSFPGALPASSVQQNPPAVVYASEGKYDVRLKVTTASGKTDEVVKTAYIQPQYAFCQVQVDWNNYAHFREVKLGDLHYKKYGYEGFDHQIQNHVAVVSEKNPMLVLAANDGYLNPGEQVDVKVWIDFNYNGLFEDDEVAGQLNYSADGPMKASQRTIQLSLPALLPAQRVGLRIAMYFQDGTYGKHACDNLDSGNVTDIGVVFKLPTGVEDDDVESGISVQPNPFDTQLEVSSDDAGILSVRIYSVSGSLVLNSQYPGISQTSIGTAQLEKGIYLLEVLTTQGVFNQKIVKR